MSYPSQPSPNPQDPQNGHQDRDAPTGPSHGAPSFGGQNQPTQHRQPSQPAPQGVSSANHDYAPNPAGGRPTRTGGEKGFFTALFDLSFRNFITIRFASILYVAGIVLLALGWLISTILFFAADAGMGVLMFFIGLIGLFVYIVLFRLMLEFYVATVRTAQNTTLLVERGDRL